MNFFGWRKVGDGNFRGADTDDWAVSLVERVDVYGFVERRERGVFGGRFVKALTGSPRMRQRDR